jgi:hypothetical protein
MPTILDKARTFILALLPVTCRILVELLLLVVLLLLLVMVLVIRHFLSPTPAWTPYKLLLLLLQLKVLLAGKLAKVLHFISSHLTVPSLLLLLLFLLL